MVYKSPQTTSEILDNITKSAYSNTLFEGLSLGEQAHVIELLENKELRALPLDKLRKIAIARVKFERRKDVRSVMKFSAYIIGVTLLFYLFILLACTL